ncbi:MAG: FkbM family methyltransferase [Nitrospina sp.]|nr:FkbM family methyltransferase [Nitrospina sp.]
MKQFIKNKIKKVIQILTALFSSTRIGRIFNEVIINDVMNRVLTVVHQGIRIKFVVPNSLNRFRAETFSTKEPETLEWIDSLPEGCVFWDIGANVGLYSIYAAKKKNCKVIAFEPSVFNLELIARNLFLNDLHNRVKIAPFALSDGLGTSLMYMTTTEWGGALSTFGKEVGWDGNRIKDIFAFPTFGASLDQAVSVLKFPPPDFIKIDVDGIEHFILQNGVNVLKMIQGILIEINDDFTEQAKLSRACLEGAGLTLLEKRHSEMFEDGKFSNLYNQIWIRK